MTALTNIPTKRNLPYGSTPQFQKADKDQVRNNAGGFTFKVSPEDAFKRFLILGTEGGTFYASEKQHTLQAVNAMTKFIEADGIRAVDIIVDISQNGRAPKNDQAIFALAYAASVDDDATRKYALGKVNDVCRIGTHLFQFAEFVEKFRGWGRGLRNAVGEWYLGRNADALGYQVTKYRQRNGWSHRDLLRLAHPKTSDEKLSQVLAFASASDLDALSTDQFKVPAIEAYLRLRSAKTEGEVVKLINKYDSISHEMIPTELKTKKVWDALLQKRIPMTALVRNLGVLSKNEVLKPFGSNVSTVVSQLTDPVAIRNSRIHPLALLFALRTYQSGQGFRGSNAWNVIGEIVDALDEAFYLAFDNVEPAGKNTLVAVDVSGSMDWVNITGTNVTPRVGAAAMAMVTLRTEPHTHLTAFSHQMVDVSVTKKSALSDVIGAFDRIPMGGTDCALPMQYAQKNNLEVDTFIVYTDNETWAGRTHPHQALNQYRQHSGRDAKLVVVGMTATQFTIADPKDRGMLDVVGMDTSVPTIINNFSAGNI